LKNSLGEMGSYWYQ